MELRGVLESSDVAEIKAKTDALQEAWTEAAQALYAQASADAGAAERRRVHRRTTRSSRTPSTRSSTSSGEARTTSRKRAQASQRGGRRRSTRSPRPTQERDEYLDALQRLKAEFDNYRKRVARDQQELAARAHERLVRELVPVLDDLERALEAAAQHEEAKLEDGVRLVHRALADALAQGGARRDRRPTACSTRTRRRRCSRSRPRRRREP